MQLVMIGIFIVTLLSRLIKVALNTSTLALLEAENYPAYFWLIVKETFFPRWRIWLVLLIGNMLVPDFDL